MVQTRVGPSVLAHSLVASGVLLALSISVGFHLTPIQVDDNINYAICAGAVNRTVLLDQGAAYVAFRRGTHIALALLFSAEIVCYVRIFAYLYSYERVSLLA